MGVYGISESFIVFAVLEVLFQYFGILLVHKTLCELTILNVFLVEIVNPFKAIKSIIIELFSYDFKSLPADMKL